MRKCSGWERNVRIYKLVTEGNERKWCKRLKRRARKEGGQKNLRLAQKSASPENEKNLHTALARSLIWRASAARWAASRSSASKSSSSSSVSDSAPAALTASADDGGISEEEAEEEEEEEAGVADEEEVAATISMDDMVVEASRVGVCVFVPTTKLFWRDVQ